MTDDEELNLILGGDEPTLLDIKKNLKFTLGKDRYVQQNVYYKDKLIATYTHEVSFSIPTTTKDTIKLVDRDEYIPIIKGETDLGISVGKYILEHFEEFEDD